MTVSRCGSLVLAFILIGAGFNVSPVAAFDESSDGEVSTSVSIDGFENPPGADKNGWG